MSQPRHAQPREGLERCAVRAELRGDPLPGTAFAAGRVLLVEQPGPWGRGGLRESRFDPRVATDLERRAAAAGVRVLAIRRPGRSRARSTRRRWMLANCAQGSEAMRSGSFDEDAALLELPLDGTAGDPDEAPLYLACAQGRRDPCCALRGRPVAAELDRLRPGRAWECSHLGGDRFAANVLVLPYGLLYGRVPQAGAAGFVATTEAGHVVVALLRGRVGMPPAAQAALAFAYQGLARAEISALELHAIARPADGVVTVRLRGPDGMLEVRVHVEHVTAQGLTCARPGPGQYVRYRPVSVIPVG